jgi:putative ABC transport system permease protein
LLAVGLLSLGAGAIGAIFAIVNATLIRPLPFSDPDRLYALSVLEPVGRDSTFQQPLSAIQFTRWRAQPEAFDRIEAYRSTSPRLTGSGDAETLRGAEVSAGMFDMLGVRLALGRAFVADEEVAGSAVVVLTYPFWQRRFGGDRSVIGRVLTIDDAPRQIVGIMPEDFTLFFVETDVLTPVALTSQESMVPNNRYLSTVGRLRAGVTVEHAAQALAHVSAQLAGEYPDVYRNSTARIVPLRDALLGDRERTLLVLAAAVLLVVLIAGANVLSLTFADAIRHRGATMTRIALGADMTVVVAGRIVQMVVLGLLAGVVGLVAAKLGLIALYEINSAAFAGMGSVSFDASVIGVTLGTSIAVALAAGLIVGTSEGKLDVSRVGGTILRSGAGRADRRARGVVFGTQIAITFLLLLGAALLARNFRALTTRSPGYDARNVLVVPMTLSASTYATGAARAQHVARMLEAVRALPGVEAASTIQSRFILGESNSAVFDLEGRPASPDAQQIASLRHVSPELLRVLKIPLRQGRAIAAEDSYDASKVAMVSESFAKKYWPGESPIGKRLRRGRNVASSPWLEVVGVVDDIMDAGYGFDVGPTFYISYLQMNTPWARVTMVVRTKGDPVLMARSVRSAIWSVDPQQALEAMSSLESLLSRSAAQPKFQTVVVLVFGAGSFMLVLAGLYATTLGDVLQQGREFGIRAALGARPSHLVGATVLASLRPVVVGLGAGGALFLPVAWMPRVRVAGVSLGDWPVALIVVAILLICAAAASALAARSLLRVDPAVVIRA